MTSKHLHVACFPQVVKNSIDGWKRFRKNLLMIIIFVTECKQDFYDNGNVLDQFFKYASYEPLYPQNFFFIFKNKGFIGNISQPFNL